MSMGIDLGTTFSCVGVWRNGKVEIITNDLGNRTTSSCVSFSGSDRLIGDGAKNIAASNPTNTIYDAKRLIGRNFNDPCVQSDMKQFPFKVIDVDNKPYFEVTHENKTKQFSPEQISSMILTKMRQIASAYVGQEITDAVITVPAYFNDSQRQATKDAGTIAGLNVMRVINEPTAAALAYGLDKISDREILLLFFDCGGGTHDVSLLSIDDGMMFETKATCGISTLGGEDFNNRLVDFCLADFRNKHQIDITSPKALSRLRTACEMAKRNLSFETQTTVEVTALHEDIDYHLIITRDKFEELCIDLFRKTMEPVDRVLTDAKIDKSQVDEIVLVGGSTRIPKIKQMLSNYFNGKKLNESVNPDEAVAYGAAIQAAILSGQIHEKLDSIILVDVIPLSLGVETVNGIMVNLIDRNTTIPAQQSKIFSTYFDNQTVVTIQIFEGERKFTRDNNCLGQFDLEGITPAPRGTPQIQVTFDIDANGILHVTALEKTSNVTKNITITNNRARSDDQIQQMLQEAQEFEEADNKRKEGIDAKNRLQDYIRDVKNALHDKFTTIDTATKRKLESLFEELTRFIDENPDEMRETYEAKIKELEDVWNPIVVKAHEVGKHEDPMVDMN